MIKFTKYISIFAILFGIFAQVTIFGHIKECPDDLEEMRDWFVESFIKPDPRLDKNFKTRAIYIPENSTEEEQKKLMRIAAYDIGSSGIKFSLVDVNPLTWEIKNVIYTQKIPTKFDITEDNKVARLGLIYHIQQMVDKHFPHFDKIIHYGRATSGFRAAGDLGKRLADLITELGINFAIIDQMEEGLLGCLGVVAKQPELRNSDHIVWDIGGGSTQLVTFERVEMEKEGKVKILGAQVGGNNFHELVLNKLFGEKANLSKNLSVNPMSEKDIQEIFNFAKSILTDSNGLLDYVTYTKQDIDFVKKKIKDGLKVYGIGAAHNFVVKIFVENNFGAKPYYTKEEVRLILKMLVGKDDNDIYHNVKKDMKDNPALTKIDCTTLILVYAMMDLFGIDKIYTLNISNVDGIVMQVVSDYQKMLKHRVEVHKKQLSQHSIANKYTSNIAH